ncbi:Methyltransferase domain-containing protein [Actinacidiphila rubida]|uniref:Methyltransferase domain-containing protein n=1 Tax=Actinacidiphila rubida TaxID=310780 RepID=A0A1H8LVZ9_9ACTN|nr:Methyltransferase domain-containing protein [Actinacidiphila rubida]
MNFSPGIVADLHGPLRPVTQDPEPYAAFVEECGGPALELGCGDGDPLLDLCKRGLDVEGVDSSADMIERCRRRAREQRLRVVLHHQRIESLHLACRYRAIFLAGPTFNLLPDDPTAIAALRGIRGHLGEGGTALVPLFAPRPTAADDIGQVRVATAGDGAELRVSVLSEDRNETERTQTTLLRYERHHNGRSTVVDRPWVLHWHTPESFEDLAAAGGLVVTSMEQTPGSAVQRYRLRAARSAG